MKSGEPSGRVTAQIVDPYLVPDTIADDILNVGIVGNLCSIEFGKRRISNRPGQPPSLDRVVVSRLVLTPEAVNDMMTRLVGMQNALAQAHKRLPPDGKPH
jgi:hypothetical protein